MYQILSGELNHIFINEEEELARATLALISRLVLNNSCSVKYASWSNKF